MIARIVKFLAVALFAVNSTCEIVRGISIQCSTVVASFLLFSMLNFFPCFLVHFKILPNLKLEFFFPVAIQPFREAKGNFSVR
jgi:hypothetical protein